jgi:hypothetical protein
VVTAPVLLLLLLIIIIIIMEKRSVTKPVLNIKWLMKMMTRKGERQQ